MSARSSSHVAASSVPARHVVTPDTSNPESHLNSHDAPCWSVLSQFPRRPWAGTAVAGTWHGFPSQTVGDNTPAKHEVPPEAVYPASHVGWHDSPLAMDRRHVPGFPFAGGGTSHGSGSHVARTRSPPLQYVHPEEVYPASHVGLHAVPLGSESGQSPSAPCSGGVTAQSGPTGSRQSAPRKVRSSKHSLRPKSA